MAHVDSSARSIRLSLLFWGAPGAGKSSVLTYLAQLFERNSGAPPAPLDGREGARFPHASLRGFEVDVDMCVAPEDEAQRRSALAEADAVLFVVDSTAPNRAASTASFAQLERMLAECGRAISADGLPIALLFNKMDLAEAHPFLAQLQAELNPHRLPTFEGNAKHGVGVSFLTLGLVRSALRNLRKLG